MPPDNEESRSTRAQPLLDPQPGRLMIHVDVPTSSDKVDNEKLHANDKPQLTQAQLQGLSTSQAREIRSAFNWLVGLSIGSALVLSGRMRVANRWSSLMETSGFIEWPSLGGMDVQNINSAIPFVGLGVFTLVRLSCARASPRSLVLALGKIVQATGIASLLGLVCVVVSWWRSDRITDTMVRELAKQVGASANFNRGYCHAWCRQTATGLAAFVRGECGSDTPTVFTEIVGWLHVGDWCKQAIANQNYNVGAVYSGISPLACLNGWGGGNLVMSFRSDFLAFLISLAGLCLIGVGIKLAETRDDSSVKNS